MRRVPSTPLHPHPHPCILLCVTLTEARTFLDRAAAAPGPGKPECCSFIPYTRYLSGPGPARVPVCPPPGYHHARDHAAFVALCPACTKPANPWIKEIEPAVLVQIANAVPLLGLETLRLAWHISQDLK